MSKIRVLIVDDAVVVRRLLSEVLSADPALEVVGVAANGRIGLAKITQSRPDLVVLDVEMPVMDGLQTLEAVRADFPHLPVIMFSSVMRHGAAATLEALALGASDYVAKPSNAGGLDGASREIRDQLIPRIKHFGGRAAKPPAPHVASPTTAAPRPAPPARVAGRVEVLAIGISTGGPVALSRLLPGLPAGFAVPIVIVQHMPPIFTRFLAERLAARSSIGVGEGAAGEPLRDGHAWVAPGGRHMVVEKGNGPAHLGLNEAPPENSCRPSVDVLFRSVAETFGPGALAVVMTGMGQDGLAGCEAIRAAGGQVLVQDEATSVVWGMPGHVARAGLADRVLPLDQLGPEIVGRVAAGRPVPAARPAGQSR